MPLIRMNRRRLIGPRKPALNFRIPSLARVSIVIAPHSLPHR
jgi:hypothetical protein